MTPLRGRRRRRARRPGERQCLFTLGAGALAALAVLIGACTISSESPDAASLNGRSGPSSGTTTNSTTGGGAATPDESNGQTQQAGDGDAATGGTAGDSPGAADSATTLDDGAGAGPDVAGTSGESEREQAAEVSGGAGSTAGEPTGAETETSGDTAAVPPDTGAAAETADGAPTADTAPAPDPTATPTGTESAFDERSKVSTVGIGSVYFGMSPEEAAERVGTSWSGIPTGGADCYVVTPTSGPPGVALWVYHGTMERVDIDTTLLRTQSGLGVGTHVGELQSRLGEKLVVEDHPFLAGWTLATFVPTDPNDAAFRIAFDISGGEVIRFRAGRTEIVALESCA